MAEALAAKKCIPCKGGIPPLDLAAAEGYRTQAPAWELMDNARRIERKFKFKNFRAAFEFVSTVADIADAEDHHPDIGLGWGYATISLHTHKIGGLHENDFIMATKIDQAFQRTLA